MTQLEKVLAEALTKFTSTNIDVAAIIEAAQACCIGGCLPTVATGSTTETITVTPTIVGSANNNAGVQTPPKAEKAPRTKKEVVDTLVKAIEPAVQECKPDSMPPVDTSHPEDEFRPTKDQAIAPVVTKEPTVGIDLTGLFVGTGADKKVVKDVFLAAVEKAKNVATLAALNATCDCGFATGDYTDNEMEVLRRKLRRWGAAQE